MRKQAKIGRTYPLRQYTYSDWALYNIKGDFSSAMYADALAMRKQLDIQRGEWRNIDLTDEDGETAVYLELLSENQLDVIIDTTIPTTGREQLGWQSKKVDDENLEAHIAMRLVASQEDENPGPSNTDIQTMSFLTNVPCLHGSENNVTCAKCLEMAESKISAPDQLAILAALREAKPDGIPIGQIFYGLYNGNATAAAVALTTLTETSPPLVYVAGYSQARIIPAPVLGEWAVKVAQSSGNDDTQFRMVFPRQWVSIHGDVLDDVWASVTQAVAGSFMFRPGISEYGLRKRYRDVFDRLELNDILKYLLVAGKLTRSTRFNVPVGMMDVEMEKNTYWFLTHGGTWF